MQVMNDTKRTPEMDDENHEMVSLISESTLAIGRLLNRVACGPTGVQYRSCQVLAPILRSKYLALDYVALMRRPNVASRRSNEKSKFKQQDTVRCIRKRKSDEVNKQQRNDRTGRAGNKIKIVR